MLARFNGFVLLELIISVHWNVNEITIQSIHLCSHLIPVVNSNWLVYNNVFSIIYYNIIVCSLPSSWDSWLLLVLE